MNNRVEKKQSMSKKGETDKPALSTGLIIIRRFVANYKAILVFFLSIILFWGCFSLGERVWPYKISYAFHELFYLSVNLGLFLLPAVAVIMILVYLIRTVRNKRPKQNIFRLLCISVIFITHIFLLRYAFCIVTTSGYAEINNKLINHNA